MDGIEAMNMDNLPMPDSVYKIRDKLLRRSTSKPEVEFFASMSLEQCQTRLSELTNKESSPHFFEKRIRGRVRSNGFYCHVLWNAFFDFGALTVFKGTLMPATHGVSVTGQFRPSLGVMIVELIWLAMALCSLIQYPDQPFRAFFFLLGTSTIIWLILRFERRLKPYLVEQLRHALNDNA
jgi:hypothetical protein